MAAEKRRFRGPGGAVFVPHHTVDDVTIKTLVDGGEWTPVDESKPRRRRKGADEADTSDQD